MQDPGLGCWCRYGCASRSGLLLREPETSDPCAFLRHDLRPGMPPDWRRSRSHRAPGTRLPLDSKHKIGRKRSTIVRESHSEDQVDHRWRARRGCHGLSAYRQEPSQDQPSGHWGRPRAQQVATTLTPLYQIGSRQTRLSCSVGNPVASRDKASVCTACRRGSADAPGFASSGPHRSSLSHAMASSCAVFRLARIRPPG